MIYLLLSVLCSTSIVLIFRAFPKYKIESFQAIVFNYLICIALGLLVTTSGQLQLLPSWSGLIPSVTLGAFFIFLFYIIARTTQKLGVAVASVAQKLSFIVPVLAGVLIFHEMASVLKFLGIFLGILAVYFISVKDTTPDDSPSDILDANLDNSQKGISPSVWMPLIVFLGSGAADLTVNIIQTKHLAGEVQTATFTVIMFFAAFVFGGLRLLFTFAKIKPRNIAAGLLLGFPNFGSVYFLVMALQTSGLESSQVFPINNVAIILASALAAWLIFKEHLSSKQIAGLVLAIVAILILI